MFQYKPTIVVTQKEVITLSGTPDVGDNYTVKVGSDTVATYDVSESKTLEEIETQLASLIATETTQMQPQVALIHRVQLKLRLSQQ